MAEAPSPLSTSRSGIDNDTAHLLLFPLPQAKSADKSNPPPPLLMSGDSDHHHQIGEFDGGGSSGEGGGAVMADVLSKARESCYKARDAFYTCVEKHADKKPTEIATMGFIYPADCKKSRANYVKSCRPSWVKHFDRQYCAKKRVQRLLDSGEDRQGPISLPQPYTFKQ
uniref:Cytochrome c oxidase assembly factor 6 n=1 Tax=Leersia perrieri TaxID=77586 RepID=A0A0D9X8B2_9ORYZ